MPPSREASQDVTAKRAVFREMAAICRNVYWWGIPRGVIRWAWLSVRYREVAPWSVCLIGRPNKQQMAQAMKWARENIDRIESEKRRD